MLRKLFPAALALAGLLTAAGARAAGDATPPGLRFVFPNDPAVLDVRRDFGAKGDGVADDTEALQRGLDASSGSPTRILFLPNGTYRLTRSLVVTATIGPWVYGETRDGVVLRLDDGITDPAVTAVLRTHPREDNPGSADWFMRNFRNFTVDAGNNPRVDGIRWFGNNSSALKHVRVRGNGPVGVNPGFLGQNGPSLVQDVTIEGFATGLRTAWNWGNTLSRITVRNARSEAVYVSATAAGIEALKVEDSPVALRNEYPNDWTWWGGVVALVGGEFSGGSAAHAAITNTSVLYARDVTAAGFARVLDGPVPGGPVAGGRLDEHLSHPPVRNFDDAPAAGLRLPIEPEPLVPWETDPAKWVGVHDFGAVPGDNQDDTAAFQRAVDAAAAAGKTTVYLRGIGGPDPNHYTLHGEVRIHGSVRHVIGLGFGRVIGGEQGRFVVDDASAPRVKLQNLQAFGGRPAAAENRSRANTLVLEGCDLKIVGAGGGDIFATDCPSAVELRTPGQRLWARQLNPEGDSDFGLVRNHGGRLWALGVKHEGHGVRWRTDSGGQTEVFGLFNYTTGGLKPDDRRPAFDSDDSAFALMGAREISFDNTFPVKAREFRGDAEKRVEGGGWIGWTMYSAWHPSQTTGVARAARPLITPAGGPLLGPVKVSAPALTPGSAVRHTLDGTEPGPDAAPMPETLEIADSVTLRARAFAPGLAPSAVARAEFRRVTPRPALPEGAPAEPFRYTYYHGRFERLPDFSKLTPVKSGAATGFNLEMRDRDDHFAVRFTGHLEAPQTGMYTFFVESDDGSRLWIGDQLVVDHDGLHAATEKAGEIALAAGRHPVTVEYFEAEWGQALAVRWSGPGLPKQDVPPAALGVKQ